MPAVWMILFMLLLQPSPTTVPAPENDLKVSIITLGPGSRVEERYGHNMLRIRRAGGGDVSFNWGVFDFDDPAFMRNFVAGRLWYWMAPMRTDALLDEYIRQDRQIWEQELNLTPAQCNMLLDFCDYNAEPQNSRYKYDYFRDNCSTRVRDAVDRVIGDQIRKATEGVMSDRTFRSESERLMAPDRLAYTGLSFILGHPTDEPISRYQEMFIPMRMREIMNGIQITGPDGQLVPLVSREVVLHASKTRFERARPPFWVPWYLLIGVALGAAAVGAEGMRRKQRRWVSRGLALLAVLWCLVSGLGAVVMLDLWFFSDHAAVRPNENILQWTVLVLPLVLILPLGLRGRRFAIRWWLYLSSAAAGLSILGLLFQALPMMDQVNGNIVALAVPANVGLAYAAWLRWKAAAAAPAPAADAAQRTRERERQPLELKRNER
jgi:hypothetical protein